MPELTIYGLLDDLKETSEVKDGDVAVEVLEGADPVIQAVVRDCEEFPVFLNVAGEQILAISYLWKTDEVTSEKRADLHEALLRANLPIPLSSFSMIDDCYVIFGALSVSSSTSEVVTEILTLSDNTLEAIDAMQEYLNQQKTDT
ncbi:MAG: DUF2170 family protein [Candidatus Krumholzibacteria bacterium]